MHTVKVELATFSTALPRGMVQRVIKRRVPVAYFRLEQFLLLVRCSVLIIYLTLTGAHTHTRARAHEPFGDKPTYIETDT